MLDDHKQAEAYAFLMDAIEDLGLLLDELEEISGIGAELLDEDWAFVRSMGKKLQSVKEILEP